MNSGNKYRLMVVVPGEGKLKKKKKKEKRPK